MMALHVCEYVCIDCIHILHLPFLMIDLQHYPLPTASANETQMVFGCGSDSGKSKSSQL